MLSFVPVRSTVRFCQLNKLACYFRTKPRSEQSCNGRHLGVNPQTCLLSWTIKIDIDAVFCAGQTVRFQHFVVFGTCPPIGDAHNVGFISGTQ